jgi:hypothetical protein
MWRKRNLSGGRSTRREDDFEAENFNVRMKANVLGAIITLTLLVAGACLTDELLEDSQSCYRPDGGCPALGVPVPIISFDEIFLE